jgi:hypothetical protein
MFIYDLYREYFDIFALILGHLIILSLIFGSIGIFYQWALYGQIGNSQSTSIVGGAVYVNGIKVAQCSGVILLS